MKHVFASVAAAALLFGMAAFGQTATTPGTTPGASGAGSTQMQSPPPTQNAPQKKPGHSATAHHGGKLAKGSNASHQSDNAMTEQLNRQELDRLQKAGG